MKTVNQPMRKKDAMQLVTGQPVYMDDVIPQDCLIVKLLLFQVVSILILPLPDWPTIQQNSPLSIDKSTLFSATTRSLPTA